MKKKEWEEAAGGLGNLYEQVKGLSYHLGKHGFTVGVLRFGTTEGLNRLMENLVRERARKAEEVGLNLCICAMIVVLMSFFDVAFPIVYRIWTVWNALGLGIFSLIGCCFGIYYMISKYFKGMDVIEVLHMVYFWIVSGVALSRHVLIYQASLAIMRKGAEDWYGWDINVPVVSVGFALFATCYINQQLTSKYNLLAKTIACGFLFSGNWFEMLYRIVHLALCFHVEETAPVSDVMLWIGCWLAVNKLDEFVDASVAYIFDGEMADLVDIGIFFVTCVSALLNANSFEDLIIPHDSVKAGILTMKDILFSFTGVYALYGWIQWYMFRVAESWTIIDESCYLICVLLIVSLMIYVIQKERSRYQSMDRAQFFFCRKLEFFERLKEYVEYESMRKKLYSISHPQSPDSNIRVVFYGKVCSGKSQLVKTLLNLANSPDADLVENISLVGGSTSTSKEYFATKIGTDEESGLDQQLLFVDTPGRDGEDDDQKVLGNVDFCVLVYNGDSDQDLYTRYSDAVKAICKKNGYKKESSEYKMAWKRVFLVRTHGDMFAWGLGSLETQFQKGFDSWPQSLKGLLENTCNRLNENILAPNGFDPSVTIQDLHHISTKPKKVYGVKELLEKLIKFSSGDEGKIVTLERNVVFLEHAVDQLTKQLNDVAGQINRQWIVRKALNFAKVFLDPFFPLQDQPWTHSVLNRYQKDEEQYNQLLSLLEDKKQQLENATKKT